VHEHIFDASSDGETIGDSETIISMVSASRRYIPLAPSGPVKLTVAAAAVAPYHAVRSCGASSFVRPARFIPFIAREDR
jgi:hypothetical protein